MAQILRRLCPSPALLLVKLAAFSEVESLLEPDAHDTRPLLNPLFGVSIYVCENGRDILVACTNGKSRKVSPIDAQRPVAGSKLRAASKIQ
jgi:hypothetical protein